MQTVTLYKVNITIPFNKMLHAVYFTHGKSSEDYCPEEFDVQSKQSYTGGHSRAITY